MTSANGSSLFKVSNLPIPPEKGSALLRADRHEGYTAETFGLPVDFAAEQELSRFAAPLGAYQSHGAVARLSASR